MLKVLKVFLGCMKGRNFSLRVFVVVFIAVVIEKVPFVGFFSNEASISLQFWQGSAQV